MDENNNEWENTEVHRGIGLSLLEGFEQNSEIQELIISSIEIACSYSLTSEQKAAFKLSFLELQGQSDELITFLDLFNCWQNSPSLAELAIRIKKIFLLG
jgi:hypothetical protein